MSTESLKKFDRYQFAIVSCARWESEYIVEWITYHRSVGFSHIYLYCNDDDPVELYEKALPFVQGDDPFVTFLYFPVVGSQAEMYLHFLRNYKHEVEYFCFLDVDEFLRIGGGLPVLYLWEKVQKQANRQVDSIYLNWCMFGNNGFETRPKGSVLDKYNRRASYFTSYMTKHITRSDVIHLENLSLGAMSDFWHYWNSLSNFRDLNIVNVFGENVCGYYDDVGATTEKIRRSDYFEKSISVAVINHYVFKSREDFLIRARRGLSGVFAQQIDYEKAFYDGRIENILAERNQIEDNYLADYWRKYLGRAYETNILGPDVRETLIISKGKRCRQSSICRWSRHPTMEEDAAGLVNGIVDGLYKSHTDIENEPWWQVDLGDVYGVNLVEIYNRLDDVNVIGRASRLVIKMGLSESSLTEVHRRESEVPFGGADGNPYSFEPAIPIPSRFVRIQLLTRNYLHLDQVQIYGKPLPAFCAFAGKVGAKVE